MTKVDHVLVNRLEKISRIKLDNRERERLCREISEALDFIGEFECPKNQKLVNSSELKAGLEQLRSDTAEKTRFAFLENVPEQGEGYVVVSTE